MAEKIKALESIRGIAMIICQSWGKQIMSYKEEINDVVKTPYDFWPPEHYYSVE